MERPEDQNRPREEFTLATEVETSEPLPEPLLSIDDVQRVLQRSRATIYRYSNTDPKGKRLNLPYNPHKLNPEHRLSLRDPLQFHPAEVARYAQDVLKIRNVNIEVVQNPSETDDVLKAILEELRGIRQLLGEWAEDRAARREKG
jgi:hypothetical protein